MVLTGIRVDIIPEPGYSEVALLENGNDVSLPGAEPNGTICYGINIDSLNQHIVLDIFFRANDSNTHNDGSNGDNHDGDHMESYFVSAYFEGIDTPILSDYNGNIQIPSGWTSGSVRFSTMLDEKELHLDVEGIANNEQINRSVDVKGKDGEEYIVIKKDFNNYGKVVIHLITEPVNTIVTLVSDDFIGVNATAELAMSYSLGSSAIDKAILTNNDSAQVSIFFGNMSTTLITEGSKVDKITKVVGGKSVIYHEDGTVTVNLLPLSEETSTDLVLTIKMKDNSTITRKLRILRTAIDLSFIQGDIGGTLLAGYVINKAYLYENKNHDPEIFDAYLQVILYKDGVVAGYKQVQIDDEDFVNMLGPNESTSMEAFAPSAIVLYGKMSNDTIEGVNSASVFLTNGPLNFDSENLPPVEYGIGSGVTIEFGGGK